MVDEQYDRAKNVRGRYSMIGFILPAVISMNAQTPSDIEKDPKFWITSSSVLLGLTVELGYKPTYISATYFKSEDAVFLLFETVGLNDKTDAKLYQVNRSGYIEREIAKEKMLIENDRVARIDGKKVEFVRRVIGNSPLNRQ